MKRTISVVAVLTVIAAGYVAYKWHITSPKVPIRKSTKQAADVPKTTPFGSNWRPPKDHLTPSKYTVKELDEPELLQGFASSSRAERLEMVTKIMYNTNLPDDVITYLKYAIHDKKLEGSTRNNMANCLLNQRKQDPELVEMFIAFYDDKGETWEWRDFAVQFLPRMVNFAGQAKRVKDKLFEIALTDQTRIAGTAMIHLAEMEMEGKIVMTPELLDNMSERLVAADTPPPTKMAILGVIGRRGGWSQRETVRELLIRRPHDDAVLRCAIGALGLIGVREDVDVILPYLGHGNPAVGMAVEGALRRLVPERKELEALLRPPPKRAKVKAVAATVPAVTPVVANVRKRPAPPKHPEGALKFETTSQTIKTPAGNHKLEFKWRFTNSGDRAVRIKSLKASCGCASAQTEKTIYQPGESGVIRAYVNVGGYQGKLQKSVFIQTDEPGVPRYYLRLTADIPVYFRTWPYQLNWRIGQTDPKTVTIRAVGETPVHVTNVRVSNKAFKAELLCIRDGRKYEVRITPPKTEVKQKSYFWMSTDFPKNRPLRARAKAVVE